MIQLTRRETLHETTKVEIKAIARQQMAELGNEALSLRAVARQMRMTAPALYRYFDSREALITALILDAFNGFADALIEADQRVIAQNGEQAFGGRLSEVLRAYRRWAIDHPTDFALIYGTPIPGYHAPADLTAPASARGIAALIRIVAEADQAGRLTIPPEYAQIPASVAAGIAAQIAHNDYPVAVAPFYMGMLIWARIHGLVMLELFQHSTPVVTDTEALYQAEIAAILDRFGLPEGGQTSVP